MDEREETTPQAIAPGSFLLARSPLEGSYFQDKIVLLLSYAPNDGAMGVVVNNGVRMPVTEVFPDVPKRHGTVRTFFLGGPVDEGRIQVVQFAKGGAEGDDSPARNRVDVADTDALVAALDQPDVHVFLGYSGWEAGQLVDELERNSWVVCKASAKTLFNTPSDQLWKTLVTHMGNEYSMWSRFPRNPEEN